MDQLSFASLDFAAKKKRTKRDVFLAEMATVVPWAALEGVIEPHYPKTGAQGGRRPFPLAVMLRIYCLQQWYNLSDPGAEEALYDIQSMRGFCGLELGRDAIPDETTILNFRHLLERHDLTKAVFAAVAEHLEARGALLKQLAVQRDLLTALSGRFAAEGLPERFDFATLHLPRELPLSLSSRVVEQRPDVRAAEANLHAAAAQVGVAIANRLPLINLTGNVGRQGSQLHDLFSPAPQFLFWTIAGSVTQTIFDGFTLEQRQRAAEAGWDQAAAQYCSTVVTAFQNVADALQMVELDGRALRAAVRGERAAGKSLSLTRDLLEQGQVSALQLLNAQQVYFAALLAVVEAKANRYADTIGLFQALGGGWWNRGDVEAAEARYRTGRAAVVVHED